MSGDIVSKLRHHYCVEGTEPEHPVRRAIEEIERLRADSAELAAVCAALGGDAFWMDPPDGGSVSIAEQVARANEAGRAYYAAIVRSAQSGPSGHSRDLPVTPADGQDYGHLAGDKPAPDTPSKVLPSDTRLWHIISRHQREAVLEETVPLNRAMYRACMEAMLDVDLATPRWIACSERMPDAGVEVLVWLADPAVGGGSNIVMDTWDEQYESPVMWSSATIPIGMGWDSGTDWEGITHWMPLPAPPKGK